MLLIFPIVLFRISHFFDPIILTPSPIIPDNSHYKMTLLC